MDCSPQWRLVEGGIIHLRRKRTLSPALGIPSITAATLCFAAVSTEARTIAGHGYSATDNVAYAFEDISTTGTRTLAYSDDGTSFADLGFTFSFYGNDYAAAYWSPNGLITFAGASGQWGNVNLISTAPSPDLPSIAVLWDDWVFFAPGDGAYHETKGTAPNRRFILQWNIAYGFSSSPSSVTFQAILYESGGRIVFQYADVDSGDGRSFGASATVGIRDAAGQATGRNLQWSFNEGVITNGEAISFQPTVPSAILFVDASTSGLENGTSWTDAFTSLQAALGVAVSGQQIWVAATPSGLTPPARYSSASCYDTDRGVLVLFSGNIGTAMLNDLWEWDGTSWSQPTGSTVSPPPVREQHSMVYDSANHTCVITGGYGTGDSLLADTWTWNTATNTWTPGPNLPSARKLHKMAYDSVRGRTVLFGGYNAGSLGDTLEWDGTGGAWTNSNPSPAPPARRGQAMAFDSVLGRTVLYGGYTDSTGNFSDTWEWDGATWVSFSGPPGRRDAGMAFDSTRGVCVLFGGTNTSNVDIAETWERNGRSWTQKSVSGPPAMHAPAMAYDSGRHAIMLLSGTGAAVNGKRWSFNGAAWSPGGEGGYIPTAKTNPSDPRSATFQLINGVQIYGGFVGSETNLGERAVNSDGSMVHETILSGDLGGNDGPGFANNGDNSYHVVTGNGTNSTGVLDGFTIQGGYTGGAPDDRGGGIYISSGSPTITHCTFTLHYTPAQGGGAYVINNSSPTFTNCMFSNNWAYGTGATYDGGAGVFSEGTGSPLFEECAFTNNLATNGNGGALVIKSAGATLTHCAFTGNSAFHGGAIRAFNGSVLTATDCTFSGNQATGASGRGGAIYAGTGNHTVSNCIFQQNNALARGGAVYNEDSNAATFEDCTFTGNRQTSTAINTNGGGAIYNIAGSNATIINCTFAANRAEYGGAGVYNSGSSPQFINCLFTGNTCVTDGGAMFSHANSQPVLTNCTLGYNRASRWGGGAYGEDTGGPALTTLRNCILWGNVDSSGTTQAAQLYNYGGASATVQWSDVHNGYPGTGNIPGGADPRFVSNPAGPSGTFSGTVSVTYSSATGLTTISATGGLPDASNVGRFINPKIGSTQYLQSLIVEITPAHMTLWGDFSGLGIAAGTEYKIYDYRLQVSPLASPCIDAGNNDPIHATGVTEGLDGILRFLDVPTVANTGTAGSSGILEIVDMGAYEAFPPLTASFIANPNPAACGQQVTFDASASSPSGGIVSYDWDFGDTNVGTGQTVQHAYAQFGTYNVVLTVKDNLDRISVANLVVNVNQGNHAPVAGAGGPYVINVGDSLQVNGAGSLDPDATCGDSIVSYEWDVTTDGTFDVTGVQPTFTWAQLNGFGVTGAGTYSVRLRVTDTFVSTGIAAASLTVYLDQINADFTVNPNPTQCDGLATFTPTASQEDPRIAIVLYEWDFEYDGTFVADSSSATATPVDHTYSTPGTRTAALRVTDSNSSSVVVTQTVTAVLSLDSELVVEAAQSTLCPTNTGINITVAASETGVGYQLRDGTNAIGSTVIGTGATIMLPTGALAATTTLNVLATRPPCTPVQLTQTATITVDDSTPPSIVTCPPTQSADATAGVCQALVPDFTSGVVATDDCSAPGALVITQSPSVNTAVGKGGHSITLTVTDAENNSSQCTSNFTVNDVTPPSISLIGGSTLVFQCIASGSNQYVEPGATVSDSCDGDLSAAIVIGGDVPDTRIEGIYQVTYDVVDSAGNPAVQVIRTVTVEEPALTISGLPADITVECTGPGGVPASSLSDFLNSPQPVDGCDSDATITHDAPGVFPLGGTLVTWTATDPVSGSQATASRTVTVTDTTPPTITCPVPPVPMAADATCHAPAPDLVVGATDFDLCGGYAVVTQSPTAGTPIPVGITTITLIATDPSNNTNSCQVPVQVVDTTPPAITACVTDTTISPGADCQASLPDFTASVSAEDNCPNLDVAQSPLPGTLLGVGPHVVTFTVTNQAGLTDTCQATITVEASDCEVVNLTQSTTHPTIPNAMLAALKDNQLLAGVHRFQLDTVIDFGGKAVTLTSRSDVMQPAGASLTMAEGSTLAAFPGASMSLAGALTVPSLARAALDAALVATQSTASLRLRGGAGLSIHGTAQFAGQTRVDAAAILVLDSPLVNSGTFSLFGGVAESNSLTVATGGGLSGWGDLAGNVVNDAQLTVQANLQVEGDYLNNGTTTVQNGVLTIHGNLINNGTIIGNAVGLNKLSLPEDATPPPIEMFSAGVGLSVLGDYSLGTGALLLMPASGQTVRVAGHLDVSVADNSHFDLANATLQMIGLAGGTQNLEVMSRDIGPTPAGLDRLQAGHYPFGKLWIGSTPTTVRLVDAHDNEGQGQTQREAIYTAQLIIDPGTSLQTNGYRIYYGTLTNQGAVDVPANLIPIGTGLRFDFNRDGRVDHLDLLEFEACSTGPEMPGPPAGCAPAAFAAADADGDGDVDQIDFGLFQRCYSGPDQSPDPNCAN